MKVKLIFENGEIRIEANPETTEETEMFKVFINQGKLEASLSYDFNQYKQNKKLTCTIRPTNPNEEF